MGDAGQSGLHREIEGVVMNLSRWKSLLALLFVFTLVAAACSGDEVTEAADDTEEAADEAADEAEDAADEAADEGDEPAEDAGDDAAAATGTVTITGPERTEAEAGAIQEVMSAWGAENGIDVTYTGSADWEAEINVAVEGGTAPDISFFPQPGKLADFARAGHLAQLPDETVSAVEGNWDPGSWSFGTVDDAQYGIPAKTDLKSLVWYQPARFEAAGYAVPETWDEFNALVDTMIADGNTPLCVGIESGQATGWPFTDWVEDRLLRTAGPEAYDQWVAGDLDFASEEVSGVMQEIVDLWNKPGAVFASGGSISATNFGDNAQPLVDGDCFMHRQASFFSGFMPEGTPAADGSEGAIDVFYFPSDGDSRPILVAGTVAGAFADRPEVWQVMEYIGSAEYANARQAAQKARAGGEGSLSGFLTAVDGADLSLYEPLEQSMMEIMANAEVARFDGSDLMPADVGAGTFWSEGTSVVNGDKSVADAAAAIDASWPS